MRPILARAIGRHSRHAEPLGGLTCHFGDQLEILVKVQNGEAGSLGHGR
jgi:hypothetical protein